MGTRDRRDREDTRPSDERDSARTDGPGLPRPRSVEGRDRRQREVRQAPRKLARSFVELPKKVNPLVTVAVILVLAFVALSVATPLRNYFQQRAELAEVNATIERQLAERDDLNEELDRYNSEAYVREQARTRLGVVEPGESAFRLMDPRIDTSSPTDPGMEQDETEPDPWYTQLWGSVATPDDEDDGDGSGDEGQDGGSDGGSGNLPIDPDQPEDPAQEGDPDLQRELQEQQQQQQQGAQ
ncbi:FtsB family cell division protein [Corynebacterium sp. AOP40-9SA-29]|uniref:FtsB family cell division protein n=1 Tax=Corynebacterium sp. AOP40-9SA-29 TaxID=3457677 RepID=UPI0040334B8F